MKKFFDWSLPLLFILSLAPLALMIINPIRNAENILYLWYFFYSILSAANFSAYLCFKALSHSFSKWSVVYIIVSCFVLMFNILISMFITLLF